jgi:hypothetical protein
MRKPALRLLAFQTTWRGLSRVRGGNVHSRGKEQFFPIFTVHHNR